MAVAKRNKGGAPKGNKNAVGNQGGRPLKYDLLKEAADLDEWSKKPDSTTLYAFTDEKPYLTSQLQEFAQQSVEFSDALKKAKERIARHREAMVSEGKLHQAAWNRCARLYDHLLEKKEDLDKDKDAERQLKVAAAQPANPMAVLIQRVDGSSPDLIGRNADPQ